MGQVHHPHSELAQRFVDVLLSEFETLPPEDRRHVVAASIEAVAWIAAMESAVYCKKNGHQYDRAQHRIFACEKLFAKDIERDLEATFHS